MNEKLLIPVDEGMNDHKRAQLEELAKKNGTDRDKNICSVRHEKGHKRYACPLSKYNFAISCDICGSCSHLLAACPLTASSQGSNSRQGSSGQGLGSTSSS
ncbi:hypothetical protein Nepgr_010420 [Nepenthes gracilis]|uniref:Branchpoint-bridging protein n=1 Tax=Nepenthes gracilis TaxID=150966 RepID=A0AAD3XLA9_NEPGR|nr:hypothetical protein Nepgr_010420 [Nepenthes gracilis]